MTDQNVEQQIEEEKDDLAAAEAAKRQQYGQSGDMLDTTMGNMGGAGAAGSGPDISRQSQPTPGNSSDLPSK